MLGIMAPFFIHVMVSPALMVIFFGVNALSLIETVTCAALVVYGRESRIVAKSATTKRAGNRREYCMRSLLHDYQVAQPANSQ